MKSLKQLMDEYPDLEDTAIIASYLIQDEVFSESIDILTKVCQRKIEAQTDYINRTQMWLGMSNGFYYEKYGTKIGSELDRITRQMQMGKPISALDEEYLKEIIPTIPITKKSGGRMFWGALYDYIHDELGLKFKDEV